MKLVKKKLTERLEVPLQYSLPGKAFWDICCDHGLVGFQALARNLSMEVGFCDPVIHQMQGVKDRCVGFGFAEVQGERPNKIAPWVLEKGAQRVQIFPRKAQEVPLEKMTGTLVMMGIGSETILQIMDAWDQKKESWFGQVNRMILGSHAKEEKLLARFEERKWKNWQRVEVLEKGRVRPFFILTF